MTSVAASLFHISVLSYLFVTSLCSLLDFCLHQYFFALPTTIPISTSDYSILYLNRLLNIPEASTFVRVVTMLLHCSELPVAHKWYCYEYGEKFSLLDPFL